MNQCPNAECHKNLEGVRKTLYGEDGAGGIVRCVANKISRNSAIAFLVFFISTGGGFLLYGMEKNSQQNKNINQHGQQIEVIKTEMKHIKDSVEKLTKGQYEIRSNQIQIKDIKSAFKDALKEGKERN